MTPPQLLLMPVFVHVLLVTRVAAQLGSARFGAVSSGAVKRRDILIDNRNWPDSVRQISNNFDNQFQAPLIWYACVGYQLITGLADWPAIVMSWIFVVSRIVHSYIHIGSNKLPDRFYAFLFGSLVLTAMWIWFALRLYVLG